MQQPSVPDIVAWVVFFAALIFSDDVAQAVGPYIVIIAAAMCGASFSVGRRDKTTRTGAALYFGRVAGLAMLITVALANVVNAYYPELEPRVTVAPIALVIGFADWPKVLAKVIQTLFAAMDLIRGKGGSR